MQQKNGMQFMEEYEDDQHVLTRVYAMNDEEWKRKKSE